MVGIVSGKIILKKKPFGIIGIIFGWIGLTIFLSFKADSIMPILISGIILAIGLLDTFRYYIAEFDKSKNTYYLEKGWRFIPLFKSVKNGVLSDFAALVVGYALGGARRGDYYYIYLQYKDGSMFVPMLLNATTLDNAVSEVRQLTDFFALPVILKMPEEKKHHFVITEQSG